MRSMQNPALLSATGGDVAAPAGVLIELTLRRAGGSVVDLGGQSYHFRPSEADPRHVAFVTDPAHVKRLLSIAGYEVAAVVDGAQVPRGATPPVLPEPAADAPVEARYDAALAEAQRLADLADQRQEIADRTRQAAQAAQERADALFEEMTTGTVGGDDPVEDDTPVVEDDGPQDEDPDEDDVPLGPPAEETPPDVDDAPDDAGTDETVDLDALSDEALHELFEARVGRKPHWNAGRESIIRTIQGAAKS